MAISKSKRLAGLLLVFFALTAFTCGKQPIEFTARDSIAAMSGGIKQAQDKYTISCQAMPTQRSCKIINQAVSVNNTLIDALEAYCGGTSFDAGTACTPHEGALPALQSALANAQQVGNDLKGLVNP